MSIEVNTAAWGDPVATYTAVNVRTGASDLTDPDFEDYPPFISNDFDYEGEINQYVVAGSLYYAYLADNEITNLNHPIDRSIAYCACKEMSIPINDILGWTTSVESSSSETPDITDDSSVYVRSRQEPIPIIFMDNNALSVPLAHGMGGFQYLYSPHLRNSYGVANTQYLYSQFASNATASGSEGAINNNTGRGRSNKSLFCRYYRDFGIRSIILQIWVLTCSGHSETTKYPTGFERMTLNTYANNTAEWRSTHPIIQAYAKVIKRRDTSGWYDGSAQINVDLTLNLETTYTYGSISAGTLIQQPSGNYDTNDLTSVLPIFGTFAPNSTSGVSMGTNPNGGGSTYIACLVGGGYASGTCRRQGESTLTYQRTIWLELEGTDENIENIRHWCAAYGLFFTDGSASETGYNDLYAGGYDATRFTHEKMCLGVVDDEGYTDGTYTRGSDNVNANNWTWKTASESKYNPDKPPPSPENTYSTATTFNSIGDLATMTKRYVLTASAVQQLGTALWDISAALSDNGADFSEFTEKSLDMFLTNNPIDAIISLQRYPMEIPSVGTTTVKLGKTDTGISAKPMEKTAYFYLFSGSVIHPKFGDSFLDYQPYTKMELYIPFCGTIQMNPADIIGRTLNVQLVVDFSTGTATGFIMSDDLVIETVNGNVAIDIPVTGIQSATVASQLNNAIANKSNKTLEVQSASLGNVSAGGVIRALKDPIKMIYGYQEARNEEQRAEYDLTHQNAPIHIIGSASAVGGWAIDLQCRLIIYYPSGDVIRTGQPPEWNDLQLAIYGRTTGFACCIEGSIGSMNSGLVVGINPDLNGMITNTSGYAATAAELDMLRAAIAEGIIL